MLNGCTTTFKAVQPIFINMAIVLTLGCMTVNSTYCIIIFD